MGFHRMDHEAFDVLMTKAIKVEPTLPSFIRLPSAFVWIAWGLAITCYK